MKCAFRPAFRGGQTCNKRAERPARLCSFHVQLQCVSCRRQATWQCEQMEPGGQHACYQPLCDRCAHVGDTHMPLPDSPVADDQARDLARMIGKETTPAAGHPRSTVVEDLKQLLVELEPAEEA
jgi:hypothetical protein